MTGKRPWATHPILPFLMEDSCMKMLQAIFAEFPALKPIIIEVEFKAVSRLSPSITEVSPTGYGKSRSAESKRGMP